MTKPKPKTKALAYDNGLVVDVDAGPSRTWAKTGGTYLAGRAAIDEADHVAAQMEAKWGCGRLRLLVSPELREKFDRQRYLTNQAIWHGDLEAVRREAARMVKAWIALDRAAEAADGQTLSPAVMELTLSNGRVAAIVRDPGAIQSVQPDGRLVEVYTTEEIARLLEGYPGLAKAKEIFPGATVVAVRPRVSDPLDGFADSSASLDDEIPF